MTGVILCGGSSTRMGMDKGMLASEAGNWAQAAAGKLSALALPVAISVNEQQYEPYCSFFSADQLVKDNALVSIRGPLQGVLSAHLAYPAEDLFILACDMPLIEAPILKELAFCASRQEAGVYVYANEGEYEPLCGIYTAAALAHIFQLMQTGRLAKNSMKYALEHVNTFSIPLSAEQKKYFVNINTHAALNGL